MAGVIRRIFSGSNMNSGKKIIQSREDILQENYMNWTIPGENIENIYKIGTFDFKTAFTVKTHEETVNIQDKFQSFPLMTHVALQKYLEKGYRYIHYGLIQVAVKPLAHTGIDIPIYMALRDKRLKRYKSSILAMIQTNICNGPIYFNCMPNFSVSLTDPLIMNSLILDVHLQGNEFEKLAEQFVIMYRIYFKLMTSHLNPKFKLFNQLAEETVLLQIEAEHSKVFVPKRLKWNEITIPNEFKIDIPQIPRNIERTEAYEIIEENEGTVLVKFNSFREGSSSSSYRPYDSYIPSRHSFSEGASSLHSKPMKVFHKNPIPEISPEQNNSPTYSPTSSQMKGDTSGIFTITNKKEFFANINELEEDFKESEYHDWFLNLENYYQERLKQEWISDINKYKIEFNFQIWLENYLINNGIQNSFKESYINVQTNLYKKWLLTDGNLVTKIHPPLQSFKIQTNEGEVLATPFKKGKDSNEAINIEDIRKIYYQNNYSNQILHTISEHIDVIHNEIKNMKITTKIPEKFPESYSSPHFQPHSLPKKQEENLYKTGNSLNLLGQIRQTLEKIDKNIPGTSNLGTIDKVDDIETQTTSEESDDSLIQKINEIEDELNDNEPLEIDKIRHRKYKKNFQNSFKKKWYQGETRNYYTRPTPPDIQYEERAKFHTKNYDGTSIYEWNIDGKSEYEILNTLQEMGMAKMAYKVKNITEQDIASLLITGFTGQLKYWWDNSLTLQDKLSILDHTIEIEDDLGNINTKNDACDYLLVTIAMHFIGNPQEELTSSKIFLTNIRCPTLSDFRWYKDMFLTHVLKRPDSNAPFWKEKFITGLPNLFSQRVMTNLQKEMGTEYIDFTLMTYGQLFAFIKKEALAACQELKFQAKYGNKRREMGSFCEAFGITGIRAPSTEKRNKFKSYRKYRKRKPMKDDYYKSFKNSKNTKKYKNIKCYKCGKPGHMANKCTSKINEIIDHITDIDEKIKERIKEKLKIQTEINQISDNEIDEEFYTSSDSTDCKCHTINMIKTSNEKKIDKNTKEFIFDMIQQIPDLQKQKEQLEKLKDLIINETEEKIDIIQPFSISKLFEKYPVGKSFQNKTTPTTPINELQKEINTLKQEIKTLREEMINIKTTNLSLETQVAIIQTQISKGKEIEITQENKDLEFPEINISNEKPSDIKFANIIERITFQKWLVYITISIYDFKQTFIAMVDSGADQSCIRDGIIPTKFYERTNEQLIAANGSSLKVRGKLTKTEICNNNYCFKHQFIVVENLNTDIILGTPFLTQIYPFWVDSQGIGTRIMKQKIRFQFLSPVKQKELNNLQSNSIYQQLNLIQRKQNKIMFLKEEIQHQRIEEQLQEDSIKQRITTLEDKFKRDICADIPNAFWERKKHIIELPYEKDFSEKNIPTKARPIQMNQELLEICKKEIESLLLRKIIRPSKSPWSCAGFYVMNQAEKERGVPRLVINYKPLNKVLQWIRYPIPNKKDLLKRLYNAKIFSKFDMKSGFWQIQIAEKDRYKTAFTVPFGHYEWNVMPFGLKNAPSEFQRIMNDIFNPYSTFSIVYIDDVLIFSEDIEQHFKHLNIFYNVIKKNGLVVSPTKMKLFQTSIRFLGHTIYRNTIVPIQRSIEFADKFPDEIKDKTQLQRFLGCLNYVAEFIPKIRQICAPLFQRLQKNPPAWTDKHTQIIKQIKENVKSLPCLVIPNPTAFMIVETDASEIGYGGILKQRLNNSSGEHIVRFYSGVWTGPQKQYSTIKKEMLSIVQCISKFQDDLLNKKFLLRIDCQSAKFILEKDVQNIASKQIFARWQAILSVFDFDIEYLKGTNNSLPDFLTREFLTASR